MFYLRVARIVFLQFGTQFVELFREDLALTESFSMQSLT